MSFRIEPILRIWPQRPTASRRKGFYETKTVIEEQQDLAKLHLQGKSCMKPSYIKVFSSK